MARQAVVILLVVVTFGILVPWYKGFTLLDPRILAAYACLALLFAAPASAELSAVREGDAPPSALARSLAILVAYAWGITVLILISALVTLNLTHRRAGLITPPWGLSMALIVFSLAGSAAVATAGALLARRFSPGAAKSILRLIFLLVVFVLALSSRLLPESWQILLSDLTGRRAMTRLAWEASAVGAILAVVLTALLLKKPSAESGSTS